ncbi:HAD family hydrolase [Virgibacillus necropolis]|uniref:HAD family hydrolase n=1 Tax=Virgibacillus necropolis TaxID=163877 RepID=UPI00384EE1D6
MIKAILFDLDDTLLWDEKSVKEAFKATCELAKAKYAINPEMLEERVRENARKLYASYETYPFTQMIGINPFEGLWGNFFDEGEDFRKMKKVVPTYRKEAWTKGLSDVGVNDSEFGNELAETFPIERKRNAYIYKETFTVLEQLKGKYQLLLLTNGSPALQHTKLNITPELKPYFDHVVISGGFGKGKPDPAIFEHALELLSVKRDEAVMVGDNLMTDILGASRVGITSIWVNRHDKAKSEVIPTYEIAHLNELLPIVEEIDRS